MKTKVRFNLGAGKNFMKWKIESSEGVIYLDPTEVFLKMTNATLRNQKSTACKINSGANKTVCSWVVCDSVEIISDAHKGSQVRYNPRVNPFWTDNNGNNIDGTTHEILYTNNRNIYK